MFIKLYNQIMENMNDDLYSIRRIANALIRANKINNDESINKSNNEKAVHYALDILTDTYNSGHFDYLLKKI